MSIRKCSVVNENKSTQYQNLSNAKNEFFIGIPHVHRYYTYLLTKKKK